MNNAVETEVIGALLHDAVEDQGGRERLAQIKEEFGPEAADIVEGCSDALDNRNRNDERDPQTRKRYDELIYLP